MSTKKQSATLVGVGVAACAACCAGPILGFLAAIGLGAIAGFALFGTVALVVAAIVAVIVVRRRVRRVSACNASAATIDMDMPTIRARQ